MYGDSNIRITPEIASRLIDLVGTRLPIPVAPLSGEGLADILLRSGALNGLKTTNRFIRKIRYPVTHYRLANASFDLGPVADFLGCPHGKADLLPLVYRTVASECGKHGLCEFFGTAIPRRQLLDHRRVAPASLRKSNHSKAMWHIRAVSFDPSTHERLLERCPGCGNLLTFWYPAGSVSSCAECGPEMDFRDFVQPTIECSDPEALRFFTGLIDPEMENRVSGLHDELTCISRGELFMLCVLIAVALDDDTTPTIGKRFFTASTASPENLAVAARALLKWPHGFAHLDDRIREAAVLPTRMNTRENRFETLLKQTKIFPLDTVATVRKARLLPHAHAPVALPKHLEVSSHSSLLKLHAFAMQSKAVRKMSKETGIPRGVLFESFLNLSLPCPDIELATALGSNAEVNSFVECVQPEPSRHSYCLPIRATVSVLFNGEISPWPFVFEALKEGKLPFIKTEASVWLDQFQVEDFLPWRAFCQSIPTSANIPDYPAGFDEIAFHLDIKLFTLDRWSPALRAANVTTMKRMHHFRKQRTTIREVENILVMRNRPRSQAKIIHLLNEAGARLSDDITTDRNREDVDRWLEQFAAELPTTSGL